MKQQNCDSKIKKVLVIFILVTFIILVLDQLTKYFMVKILTTRTNAINIIRDYLRLNLVFNPNLIWGIPLRNYFTYYFLPLIGVGFVIYLGIKAFTKFEAIIWGLILAGALGNFIDRVRLGYVIDFIDMGICKYRWPTYNLADSALVIGMLLLVIKIVFVKGK
ncbi:MAG: signal peptidase II [candidate division WOR-3 bacterium]|nr:signal peptidase II [candidate division WOR-3 bacterium]